MIPIPVLSAGLAISLEPTGWLGYGTVSRTKDHVDKTLQDYIVLSHMIQNDLSMLCREIKRYKNHVYGRGFYMLTKKYMKLFRTNLSFGSLFLLYYNTISACKIHKNVVSEIRREAYSILLRENPYWYYMALVEANPSFLHRYSSSMLPDTTTPWMLDRFFYKEKNMIDMLRLNTYDPVSREAVMVFQNTFRSSLELNDYLSAKGRVFPDSDTIDWLYLYHCERNIDYLVYRKKGLRMAREIKENCKKMREKTTVSLGSIGDLVVLSLYYYFIHVLSELLDKKKC